MDNFAKKLSRFEDFENTVDRGSAVNFGVNSGFCSFDIQILVPKRNVYHRSSIGGKDFSSDAQIRVIGLMVPEICTKMLKKMSEFKPRAKFPVTTPGCSMVNIGHLDYVFLEVF